MTPAEVQRLNRVYRDALRTEEALAERLREQGERVIEARDRYLSAKQTLIGESRDR